MFWSKIWLFVVALAAAAAFTIALALPRDAHKNRVQDERQRLVVACDVVNILLETKARTDVDLVGIFARDANLVSNLGKVKADQELKPTEGVARDLAQIATELMKNVEGDQPKMAIITDVRGRVIARVGVDEGQIGDVIGGRFLVDDALSGYLRDDVWYEAGSLFLVAGSPVVSRATNGDQIIGAVVLGWKLEAELADGFVEAFRDTDPSDGDRSIHVGFFAADKPLTRSSTTATVETDVLAEFARVDKPEAIGDDCKKIAPFYAKDAKGDYAAVLSRLPGEATHDGAFFAVFTPRPVEGSFGAAVGKAKGELGGGFPWVLVGVVFLVAFGGGVALMIVETDRPLRRLQADAVRLAKGEAERLAEDDHGGRFGSIARSVNIQVDKLGRDARAAKKDLDQLLGPAPEGSLGALDLLGGSGAGTPLPARPAVPGGMPSFAPAPAPAAPPPSEFRFDDGAGSAPKRPPGGLAPDLDLPTPRPPGRAAAPAAPAPPRPPVPGGRNPTPAPRPPAPPPPMPPGPPKKGLDDDILAFDEASSPGASGDSAAAAADGGPHDETYFRSVFDQFVELKRKCGEPTAGLTFTKFGDKLKKNRDDLFAKTQCTKVRFTVYVKDGKAALKATPVKD